MERPDATTHFDVPEEASPGSTIPCALPSLLPDLGQLPPAGLGDRLIPQEALGEGGMGIVTAARDQSLGRSVAVKRPRTDSGPRTSAALVAEARTLARLDHPNVVPVHALAVDEAGRPVLVMKRIHGQRWLEVAREPDLERDVLHAIRVADALSFAHAQGVLHRDVKLDNVMVGSFGEVYLMDWGCACALDGAKTTEIVGTPTYMAPEMTAMGHRIGPATDTFLLAATLHRALTGRPRYPGHHVLQVLGAAASGHQPEWPTSLPAELGAILAKATAFEPADRYPDPAALARELRGFLAHRDALHLVAAVTARLAALEADVAAGRSGADLRFAECHFAFRSVLSGWATCAEARAGVERACALWIPWKLSTGEYAAVEAVLAELEPALAAPYTSALAAAQAQRERAEHARWAASLDVATHERRNMAFGLLFLATIVASVVTLVQGTRPFSPTELVVLGAVGVVVPIVALLPFRARLLAHRASRAIALGIVWLSLMTFLHRLFAWLSDQPSDITFRADMWVLGGGAGMWSLTIAPEFALVAAPYIVAGTAMWLWPGHESMLFPLSAWSSIGIGVALFARRASATPAGPPAPAGTATGEFPAEGGGGGPGSGRR